MRAKKDGSYSDYCSYCQMAGLAPRESNSLSVRDDGDNVRVFDKASSVTIEYAGVSLEEIEAKKASYRRKSSKNSFAALAEMMGLDESEKTGSSEGGDDALRAIKKTIASNLPGPNKVRLECLDDIHNESYDKLSLRAFFYEENFQTPFKKAALSLAQMDGEASPLSNDIVALSHHLREVYEKGSIEALDSDAITSLQDLA